MTFRSREREVEVHLQYVLMNHCIFTFTALLKSNLLRLVTIIIKKK